MTDAEARKRKLNAELANGRLAMMPSLECSTRMASPAPPGETGPCMWTRRSGLLKVLCTGPMINNGFHHLDTTNTKKWFGLSLVLSCGCPLTVCERIEVFLKGCLCTECRPVAHLCQTHLSVWLNAEFCARSCNETGHHGMYSIKR